MADLGSASLSIYAIAVAIMLAATSLYRELEQKTIFPILTRPSAAASNLVGKCLGTLLTPPSSSPSMPSWSASLAVMVGVRCGDRRSGGCSLTVLIVFGIRSKRIGVYLPIPWAALLLVVAALLASVSPMSDGSCLATAR